MKGDCLKQLKKLKDNSVDSVVTDPPYHLTSIVKRFGKEDSAKAQYGTDGAFQRASKGFMGKEWDGGDIAFRPDVWEECYRVLKPGGHLLAFSHSRTYHRMGVAIEDAGFEIRDQIMWIYGSGFPKSHNIGKAVDKLKGNEREVVGKNPNHRENKETDKTWEHQIHTADGVPVHSDDVKDDTTLFGLHPTIQHERVETTQGRFPANIIFDEEAGKILETEWYNITRTLAKRKDKRIW